MCRSKFYSQVMLLQMSRKQKDFVKLECGPMPNVMAAQPNIGGALGKSSVILFLV